MEKAKLCPFCGETAEMKTEFRLEYGGEMADVFIKCQNPNCGVEGAKITVVKNHVGRVFDSAVMLWNRRKGVGATMRRGEWKTLESSIEDYKAMCSICGYVSPFQSNFCPHCGAEMDLNVEG